MKSPLSPEAVAQMVTDVKQEITVECVNSEMDRLVAGRIMKALTTLAAENATLRAERDAMTERATDAELNWANCTRLAQRLRASEAAAMERVKVLTEAGNILAANASRFHSALWSDAIKPTEGN